MLASNNVYRSPDSGEWFHREEYPDGRTMITLVNPNAELRRARGKTPPLTLVPFIRCARFEDDESPDWRYSPDRNVEQPPNAVEGTGTELKSAGTELKSVEQTEPLVPATPRKPVPIERVPGRPQVPVQYRSDPNSTAEDGFVPDSTGEFTQDELNVLGDAGIVRSPQGEFINRILEKNGFTSEGVIRRERAQENDHPCEPSCGATSSE